MVDGQGAELQEEGVRYAYRLTTPLGKSIHYGEGPVPMWPASLKRRCRLWWLLNPEVEVEMRPVQEGAGEWKEVFRWPAREVLGTPGWFARGTRGLS